MSTSELDLWFTVTFINDGSNWEGCFKRLDRWSNRKQEYVASSKFHNSFMDGEDEMNVTEIKNAFSIWLEKVNPGIEFKIKWYYA